MADQRSTGELEGAQIFPVRELLPTEEVRARAAELLESQPWGREQWERLSEGATFDGMESWLPWLTADEHLLPDLLPSSALVALVEPRRLRDRAQELLDEEAALAGTLATTWGAQLDDATTPRLSLPFDRLLAHTKAQPVPVLAAPDNPDTPVLAASAFDPVVGDTEALARRLLALKAAGFRVIVAAEGTRLARTASSTDMRRRREGAPVDVVVAPLDRGVVSAGRASRDRRRGRPHRPPARAPPAARRAQRGKDYYEGLAAGDYVVHRVHGIGRYIGMETQRDVRRHARPPRRRVQGRRPRLRRLRRHRPHPQVHRRRGAEALEDGRRRLGEDARRACARRCATSRASSSCSTAAGSRRPATRSAPDTPFQQQIEESFPYEETPDQAKAIVETKADMERPVPMDRLVCGDVGYGKTEVALRAAAKAVFDGKQVAILVPTTLLASQHGQTFRERFANYPVRVEVLSRFLSNKEQNAVVKGVRDGIVDIVIGTHRLLSDDIVFKDLGLLVVDEEQRFGVQHKERIKEWRTNVDVLTLTATPIPRTLEMSLTGIRDLSLVNTPPEDRQPILTYVDEFDERPVSEAIRRELLREGPGAVRAQPRARHRARRRRRAASRTRSARRGRARADGREAGSSASCRSSGSTNTTCSSAPRSSRAVSTCRR